MATKQKVFGWHLILDCHAGRKTAIKDKKNIERFVKHLVKKIEMDPIGDPIIMMTAEHDPTKSGYSLVQLIQTSNITGHFIDQTGDFFIDLFSCKEYNVQTVIDIVQEYFDPLSIKQKFIKRKV